MKVQQCCQLKWYQRENLRDQHLPSVQTTQTKFEQRNWLKSKASKLTFYLSIAIIFLIRLWNIKSSAPHYQLYLDFIITVSNTNYKNMNEFHRFANMSDFNKIDYLMIAREMKINVPLASNYFTRVITEVSMNTFFINSNSHMFFAGGNLSEFNKVLQAHESFFQRVIF